MGAPIDFMGIEIGSIKSINAEFYNNYKQIRMRVEAVIYPSRVENGQALNPNSDIFKDFVEADGKNAPNENWQISLNGSKLYCFR